MWELVTQLLRLPFDIMQRVSQRVLHIGRALYTGIFGSPPAIKPSPSPPPPPKITPSSFQSSPIPQPSKLNTASVVIDMEPSPPIAELTTTSEQSSEPLFSVTAGNPQLTSSITPDAQIKDDLDVISSAAIPKKITDRLSDVTTSGADVIKQAVQVSTCEAETCAVVDDDKDAYAAAASTAAPVNRREKRFREKEKRRQEEVSKQNVIGTGDNDKAGLEDNSSHQEGHGSAKKPKLSVESSASSCQDASEKISKNKKRRQKKKKKVLEVRKGEASTGGGNKMGFERPPPPNYFIALQISNQDIISKVAQLQKSFTERELNPPWHELKNTEIFKDAMVPVSKLHFTLHVMHLKGEEDLQKAQTALTECCSEVHQEFVENPMDLTIEGLGHFRNNVIFAQIKEKSHITRLTKVSEIFRKKFNALNIPVDPRPFNPHMTIAKISRSNKLYKKKIRAFPPDIWSGCEQTHFGIQRVAGLQLLQMAGEDKATGYYVCHGQYFFEDPLVLKKPIVVENEEHQQENDEDKDKK